MKKLLVAVSCLIMLLSVNGCESEITTQNESITKSQTFSFAASNKNYSGSSVKAELKTSAKLEYQTDKNLSHTQSKSNNTSSKIEVNNQEKRVQISEKKIDSKKATNPVTERSTRYETSTVKTTKNVEKSNPKITQEQTKNIDIDEQIRFAKEYAESIGLKLDHTATDCWDNPIRVSLSKTDVSGDIKSRLNRYKNIERFSSVWIWAEKVSNNEYELFIGYA